MRLYKLSLISNANCRMIYNGLIFSQTQTLNAGFASVWSVSVSVKGLSRTKISVKVRLWPSSVYNSNL